MPPKEKLVQLVQRGSCTRTSGRYHRSRRFQIESVLPGVQVSKKRPAHKCGQCSGGSGIVDRRAKEEAVIVPGNRQEIIDTILKHTASLLSAPPAVNTALYWLGSDPKQIRAHSLAAKHGCDLG